MAGQGVLPSLAAAAGATCVMMRLLLSSARGLPRERRPHRAGRVSNGQRRGEFSHSAPTALRRVLSTGSL